MNDGIGQLANAGKLICPECGAVLVADGGLNCNECNLKFPALGDIPVLMKSPMQAVVRWRQQFLNFIKVQQQSINHERKIIDTPSTYPPFRKRLENLVRARHENMQAVGNLMIPLRDLNMDLPAQETAGSTFDFTNLLYLIRDWGWDTGEPELMCDKVKDILPDNLSVESLLVLGAGGCKESYLLHEYYDSRLTVSVDIDPFKLLAAAAVVSGEKLNLYQILPNNVRTGRDHVSYWELQAQGKPDNAFLYMLADAGSLPFPDNSFQVIFTPFLIDAAGEDFRLLASKIARILQPGGYWVNYGAMNFRPEVAYTGEEVLSILADTGLQILNHGYASKPHIAPRESCLRQVFDCLYFTALKES